MDVNTALRLLAAMVVLTSQPYNTEGRNICSKDLRKLQKRSGEDVVLLEGYEVSPKDEERGSGCVEYEATSPVPTPAAQTTTRNNVPYTVNPVPTPKKPTKKQLCWVYYGKPVKLYLPMRNLPTLPNPQGNKQISGLYTGGMKGSVNTQPRVVCGKLQWSMRSFPKVLQDYTKGGKQDIKGSGSVKPIVVRPATAIQVSSSGSSSFYNLLRSYQRLLAVQRPRGSSVSSRCV
ncbi:uncharacterized protein LOC125271411 [Megalobrama amblycephala]|uniref:uncharacterized protein LOC125271411 n=1 Tax=Megalobrama amblycephala TaxID=75352 RepID=UPI0020145300|nr:uncharacterized protein LOC125271411 [Megalobrama amblycephala]